MKSKLEHFKTQIKKLFFHKSSNSWFIEEMPREYFDEMEYALGHGLKWNQRTQRYEYDGSWDWSDDY